MPEDDKPLPLNPADLPPDIKVGQPIKNLPPGAKAGAPIKNLPADALPATGLPELPKDGAPFPGDIPFKEPPRMKAGPYVKRAIKLLKGHMGIVALSFLLSLIMSLLPFVAAAALGPLFKLFGQAAQGGDWSKVWALTSSFYDKSPD